MNFKNYFETLKDWKKLPAYLLRPRIDSFIGFYLPDILKETIGIEVKGVIPELPLRIGTIHPEYSGKPVAERSYKVNFYATGTDGVHYFIQIKTAAGSLRDPEDDYLEKAKERGMEKIVNGLTRLAKISTYSHKNKYTHLLKKLTEYGLLNERQSYTSPGEKIELIYIQPNLPRKDKGKRIIDFGTVADILKEKYPDDEFVTEFTRALKAWTED